MNICINVLNVRCVWMNGWVDARVSEKLDRYTDE